MKRATLAVFTRAASSDTSITYRPFEAKRLCKFLAIALGTTLVSLSHAAPVAPNAGSLSQQLPTAPEQTKSAPQITVQQANSPSSATTEGPKFTVRSLRISGAQAFSESQLVAASEFVAGSELNLQQLRQVAAKITAFYQTNGYFVAQAYLPAQEIKDGQVTINVLEGRYDQIKVNDTAGLSSTIKKSALGNLASGQAITTEELESGMLNLSDIAGIKVRSTLTPGASVGTSDLIIDVNPAQKFTGSVDTDNAGNYYTGIYRTGANVNVNNLTRFGDVLSVRAISSFDAMNYRRAAYQAQVGKAKIGVAYASMDYRLQEDFTALNAYGRSNISSLYASYPLIRSRDNNLSIQFAFDKKALLDRIAVAGLETKKRVLVGMASVVGDNKDDFGAGGTSNYSATLSQGHLRIQSPDALSADQLGARTAGRYQKISYSASRTQNVAPNSNTTLYFSVSGQLASQNLDTSEKMSLGGLNGVRAYPEGEASGDAVIVGTGELRHSFYRLQGDRPSQLQLVGFLDAGNSKLNESTWTSAKNRRTLMGTGIGLSWINSSNLLLKLTYAHKLTGSEPVNSAPNRDNRFWIQGVKYF
jgi:hemolysin activation/secretion protein